MSDVFKTGELFVYVNGDRWELGMVKRENNSGDGYFCWYHRGDTAANTPTRCMHKLANAGWTHIEQQMDDLRADLQASEHVINQIANAGFDANAENDKLRELVRRYSEYTDQDRCEGCVYKSRCNDGYVDECWQLTEIRGLARELGVELPA